MIIGNNEKGGGQLWKWEFFTSILLALKQCLAALKEELVLVGLENILFLLKLLQMKRGSQFAFNKSKSTFQESFLYFSSTWNRETLLCI